MCAYTDDLVTGDEVEPLTAGGGVASQPHMSASDAGSSMGSLTPAALRHAESIAPTTRTGAAEAKTDAKKKRKASRGTFAPLAATKAKRLAAVASTYGRRVAKEPRIGKRYQVDVLPLSEWQPGGDDDNEHTEPTLVPTKALAQHVPTAGLRRPLVASMEYERVHESFVAAKKRTKKPTPSTGVAALVRQDAFEPPGSWPSTSLPMRAVTEDGPQGLAHLITSRD